MPVRILLIGAVVFLAAWFTVLRPKPETIAPTTTTAAATPTSTPVTGLGRAVAAARKAAGTTAPAATTQSGSAAATTAQKAPGAAVASVSAATLAKLPKDLASALKARRIVVLAVLGDGAKPWRPLSDDDRYVRNALDDVNRYDGEVFVKPVPASKLSAYHAVVGDLDVAQTPSIVVIDRDLKGTVLPGYVDRVSINQAIVDARRASITPYIADAYLRKVSALCGNAHMITSRWSLPTVRGAQVKRAAAERYVELIRSYRDGARRLTTPAKWRGLHGQLVAQLNRELSLAEGVAAAYKDASLAKFIAATSAYDTRAAVKAERSFERAGVTGCAWRHSR
jgi:hypothetical protein